MRLRVAVEEITRLYLPALSLQTVVSCSQGSQSPTFHTLFITKPDMAPLIWLLYPVSCLINMEAPM